MNLSLLEANAYKVVIKAKQSHNAQVACSRNKQRLGLYVIELCSAKGQEKDLWATELSLTTAWDVFEKVAGRLDGEGSCNSYCRTTGCAAFQPSTVVLEAVRISKQDVSGMCLGCAKMGDFKAEGDCKHDTDK